MLKRIAILHHPQSEAAVEHACAFERQLLERGVASALASVWDDEAEAAVDGADLVVCIGGDGSVLRAAHVVMPRETPILGVNMGRLGFLTDLAPQRLLELSDRVIAGDWRLERRIMVRATLCNGDDEEREFHGLNDAVVSHRSPGRPIYVEVVIDGAPVSVYRCDGIIVSSPTGSTGYSLAAGGPIMAPTEKYMVMTPISAHLALGRAIVLLPDSLVELRIKSEQGAVLSVDGQDGIELLGGAQLRVGVSEHVTVFARFDSPSSFYAELVKKLESQSWEFAVDGGP